MLEARSLHDRRCALMLSFLAFTLCFSVWTIFSILGIEIQQELGLNDTQLGLLVATPILSGSISRLLFGILADRVDGRWIFGLIMLTSGASALLVSFVSSYQLMLLAALGVGLSGGAFIVGVTYVVSWYPADKQGLALGIFGAGNVGAAVTSFFAPLLLLMFNWQATAQIYASIISAMGLIFIVFSKPPSHRTSNNSRGVSLAQQLEVLADIRVWRFSLYYFFVFGAFVALSLWLPHYFMNVYSLGMVSAGLLSVVYIVPASLFRILGGRLCDRYGARRVMYWTLIATTICCFFLSYPPTEYRIKGVEQTLAFSFHLSLPVFLTIIFILGFFMSLGKAAVFKHIPTYYPNNVGAVGGAVSMVGGLGGFFLPLTFGMLNDVIGVWQSTFMLLFVVSALALFWMHYAIRLAERREWSRGEQNVRDLPELSTPDAFILADWRPEDKNFWQNKGKRIARRNLWISIPNLFLAFSVWSIWSILVVNLPQLGFSYNANQLFWLAALPALSGATFRIFYSFMVPIFGGRRWTAISTASLILPCVWLGVALQNTQTSYLVMLILALLCGFGGGNFASSMANISFFYPKAEKGGAMGLNAGLGNLGVSAMQLVGPLVITSSSLGALSGEPIVAISGVHIGEYIWLQNTALIWVPFIIIGALLAWFGMNDIASAKSSFRDQMVIFNRKHTWLMCWLYLGAFGSFIGFAAGFPLLSEMLFKDVDPIKYAFVGPLMGALARPVGGIVADKFGGAKVTLWMFIVMIVGVMGVIYFLPSDESNGNFWGFFSMFVVLFVASGILNGSTFRMVPVMFLTLRQRALGEGEKAEVEGNRESAAVLGFISAIAAYGGFFIPKAYGTSFSLTGSVAAALMGFIVFYLSCLFVTWWYYTRKGAEVAC